ncbi:MAG: hypothetical protein ACP5NM_13255 [Thiomonas sp.]
MSATAALDTAAVVAAVDDELTTACLVLADIRIRRTVRRHEIERLKIVAERIGTAVAYLEREHNGR